MVLLLGWCSYRNAYLQIQQVIWCYCWVVLKHVTCFWYLLVTRHAPVPSEPTPERNHFAASSAGSPSLTWRQVPMSAEESRSKFQVKSKQWSCSSMVDGHNSLLSVKTEGESRDQLQKKIQDWLIFLIKFLSSKKGVNPTSTGSVRIMKRNLPDWKVK